MKKHLTDKEIKAKKELAGQHKGISYSAVRDDFIVRLRVGTDFQGKPIYFQPVRRYNNFSKALECLNLYKELAAAGNMARLKKVTLKTVDEFWQKRLEEAKKAALSDESSEEVILSSKRDINTMTSYVAALSFAKKYIPHIYELEMHKYPDNVMQNAYNVLVNQIAGRSAATIASYFKVMRSATFSTHFTDNFYNTIPKNLLNRINKQNFFVKQITDIKAKDTNPREVQENLLYNFAELHKLLKEAQKIRKKWKFEDERLKVLILLLLATGVRIGELQNVTVKKIFVDEEVGTAVKIHRQYNEFNKKEAVTKTQQSNRTIPLCSYVYREVQKYINDFVLTVYDKILSTSPYLANVSITQTTVSRKIAELEMKAGVEHKKGRSSHAHRRDLVTYFENVFDISPKITRYFVGHEDSKADSHIKSYNIDTKTKKRYSKIFVRAQKAFIMSILAGYNEEAAEKLHERYKSEKAKEKVVKDGIEYIEIGDVTRGMDYVKYYEQILKEAAHKSIEQIAVENDWYEYEEAFSEYEEYKQWRTKVQDEYNFANRKLREAYPTLEDYLQYRYASEFIPPDPDPKLAEEVYELIGEPKDIKAEKTAKILYSDDFMEWWYNNELDPRYKQNNSLEDFKIDVKVNHNAYLNYEYMYKARHSDKLKEILIQVLNDENLPKNEPK